MTPKRARQWDDMAMYSDTKINLNTEEKERLDSGRYRGSYVEGKIR